MEQGKEPLSQKCAHAIVADRIFDGERWHGPAAILINDGCIHAVVTTADVPAEWPQRRLPPDTFLAPGFIDLQVNGGGGVLLNDNPTPDAMRAIARAHRRFGTTSCLPTMITDQRPRIQAAITAAREAAGRDGVLGIHLEGPFISPGRPGIHRPDYIQHASMDDLEWLAGLRAAGCSLITLAPECVPPGFIKALADLGVRIAVGHSEATAEQTARAIDEGLTGVTHLYNAMPPMKGREPGIVGMALADPRLIASLIADGLHVDPIAIRAAFAAKGADGIALVTDAMPTVGASADHFQLMGRTITLHGQRLASENGTLAGAHLDMASAVRNAVELTGITLEDALRAASLTPARFLGVDNERGMLKPGARTDIVALTSRFDVIATWVGGVFEAGGHTQ
ncbi:N-acetylglucosamine-6-phosphate deacetylase [Pseudorhodoplanes sinuspersici]|uniref:N-acetylglucosamine-6-phosphate deacetylase n=1 Tax=Pseudorhodoplanes sinuspersici TaxID=1235591 RepID=A0A1W6ZKA0_9HYPH|nr:N-acetylglucosamine-6-phosphate deacetylase [Pseudorhodoplanes sinuspersici]ARP97771.1 N-acetylglucosamine-6-phosphate deacetylase [Pseudorhodoplanes sinuspersici]RKE68502.1 N-acetylglucosamine-6-phosphate deacetylase [Pseudorhodoplanes sinuspersici]